MSRDSPADKVGHMPPVEDMPEVPVHRLEIAGEDGTEVRYVDSGYFDYGTTHLRHQYLIVRCGICGHDSTDWGLMKGHAWMAQEMHFDSRHVGKKIVWRAENLPSAKAATHSMPSVRESRYSEEDNEWDAYEAKLRGDCPDDKAAEIVRERLEDGEQATLLIEHRPSAQPYPGSIEEGAELEVRPAPDNPPEAIA